MARLRALKSFAGLEGRIRRGAVFETNEHRAAYLTINDLAERLDAPSETPTGGPTTKQPTPTPTELADVGVEHVGGGWYEWNGRRYRGRAAAEEAAARGE